MGHDVMKTVFILFNTASVVVVVLLIQVLYREEGDLHGRDNTGERDVYSSRRGLGSYSSRCKIPQGGFRGWETGVITTLEPHVPVNCSRVISGDELEVQNVTKAVSKWKNSLSDQVFLMKAESCSWLREIFSDNLYITEMEISFPLAFTFVVYNSPQQVLRLIRLLYRPHNSYCLHYDVKSKYKDFFRNIANCFENIITPSKVEDVVWGKNTVMEAQLNCMTDLLKLRAKQKHKWKYVINLCGKELPLATNKEMVAQLMLLNGSSSIVIKKSAAWELKRRVTKRVKFLADKLSELGVNQSSFYKSSSYSAISIKFANFLIFDSRARKFHEFFKLCRSPEEHFYATLFMLPGVPGGFNRNISKEHYFQVSRSFWIFNRKKNFCRGKLIHSVCIVAAADLSRVVDFKKGSNHLFHNKYFMGMDHTVMTCMEERIVAQNILDYQEECRDHPDSNI